MTYVIGHLLLPRYASWSGDSSDAGSRLLGYDHDGGEDFAVTFRVLNMKASVRFYINVLGMEIIYGGEDGSFSSLRGKGRQRPYP
jgi:hypothetical protein